MERLGRRDAKARERTALYSNVGPIELKSAAPTTMPETGGIDDGLDHAYPAVTSDRQPPSRRDIALAAMTVLLLGVFVAVVIRWQTEQARTINCAANMSQIGAALLLYEQDNDDTFPNRLTGWPVSAHGWREQEAYTWRSALKPYLRSAREIRCLSNPMNTQPTGCQAAPCGDRRASDGFVVSYACNCVPAGASGSQSRGFCADKNAQPVIASEIESPSDLIAVVEDESPWSEFDVLKPAFRGLLFTGHNGASNYLFADGHVAVEPTTAMVAPSNRWVNGAGRMTGRELAMERRVLGVGE